MTCGTRGLKRLTEKKKRSDSYWAERDGRPAQGVRSGGLKGTGRLGKIARRPAQTWPGLADRLGLGSTGRLGAARLDGPKQRPRPNSSLSYRRVPRDSVIPPADCWVLPVSERADLVRLTRSGVACTCVAKVCVCDRHECRPGVRWKLERGGNVANVASCSWAHPPGSWRDRSWHEVRRARRGTIGAWLWRSVGSTATRSRQWGGVEQEQGVRTRRLAPRGCGQAKRQGLGPCSGRARVFAAF